MTLDIQKLASFLDRIDTPSEICVAVSGGRDSMALLHALHALGQYTVHALTVDHGLREGSAKEAETVKANCEEWGIQHHTLQWSHNGKIDRGLQEQARQARYQLMFDYMDASGITALCLAHQLDDQVETFWMRLQRGSGLKGLSSMRPMSVRDNKTLIRPFLDHELDVTREVTTAYCEEKGVLFIDDPSNSNDNFERVRVRETLDQLYKEETLSREGVLRSIQRLERHDRDLDYAAHKFIEEFVSFDLKIGTAFIQSYINEQTFPLRRRVFDYVLAMVGGRQEPLLLSKLEDCIQRLDQEQKLTLAGCCIERTEEGFSVLREQRHLPEPITVGEHVTNWDGRFDLSFMSTDKASIIKTLDEKDVQEVITLTDKVYTAVELLTLPALYNNEEWWVIPSLALVNPKLDHKFTVDFSDIKITFKVIDYLTYQGRVQT